VTNHFSNWDRSIELITISRGRPSLLKRAIRSVQEQCCFDAIAVHHVVVDDDFATISAFAGHEFPRTKLTFVKADEAVMPHGPERLAELRSRNAAAVKTRLMAFLDDDNWWLPTHLHTLLDTMEQSQSRAVHSWCRVVDETGVPFLGEYDPWTSGWDEAAASYSELVTAGVATRQSNVFRDRADPSGKYPGALSVDAGEWLLSTALVREIGYPRRLERGPGGARLGDDDLFLRRLVQAGVKISCTEDATLCYQLGGFSTSRTERGMLIWQSV